MLIAEVAQKYGVSVDTIRYYERIGLIPRVHRQKNGIRDFTDRDCGWVEFIRCMRDAGMPIEALIDYVTLFQQGEHTASARKELLIEQRARLAEKAANLAQTIERLDDKIANYETNTHEAATKLLHKA